MEPVCFDDSPMREQRLSKPRKRAISDPPLCSIEASPVLLKKRKIIHPNGPQPPAEFWDNLTEIPLTSGALKEADRRNVQELRRGRTTRRCVATGPRDQTITRVAEDFLSDCTPKDLRELRVFARRGGPDLLDIRGVCGDEYPCGWHN